ncbi:MAG: hypothetical protein OXU20_27170 [Myxococcales bacterium]|nr:hypothetical protein [Myxococcales bacterium]MDD9967531.1 hypothetical protein [Myxococcales bacterium]
MTKHHSPYRMTLMVGALTWLSLTHIARAQQTDLDGVASLDGVMEVSVGFGEIPFLSGSFKPSVSVGYHVNEYVYLGWTVQLRDVLERGTESFNAVDTGLGGIESTREETGIRSLLAVRLRPHRYSPFVSMGFVFNGSDREVMHFDGRRRTIGAGSYDGAVVMEQTRPWGIRPAIGLGYSYQFETGLSLSMELAGAFLSPAPAPDIRIDSQATLSDADRSALSDRSKRAFAENLHNRYHMFQLSAGYVW